jgi:hypothetical protein
MKQSVQAGAEMGLVFFRARLSVSVGPRRKRRKRMFFDDRRRLEGLRVLAYESSRKPRIVELFVPT